MQQVAFIHTSSEDLSLFQLHPSSIMRCLSFFVLSAILAGESSAAKIVQLSDVIPIESGVVAVDVVVDKTKEVDDPPMLQHYGHPPDGCEKDEAALQIQNVPGMICSPHCADIMPCPTDVPAGVTAQPTCAIQDQEGHHYCVLLCSPGDGDGQCGEMTCQPIQGLGVCTYDS